MQVPELSMRDLEKLLSVTARYRQMAREIVDVQAIQALLTLASEMEAEVTKAEARQKIHLR